LLDREVVSRLSTVMIAVSDWDRRNIIDHERIPPHLIKVIHNGIVSPPEHGPDARPGLGVAADAPLVGAVGRLYPEKGYDELIRAIALLKQRVPAIRCVILGDGPHQQSLQALIDQLGVGAEVRLIGRREDVPDVIRALDVAVLPSQREGSPLALMEYMAGAAPIVATAVGGVPEMVHDGVHAVLVAQNDTEQLAEGIERLLGDRALAERLGRAAQARQRAEYDLEVLVRRLEDMYFELYRESARARLRVA
jgi:glycosyltransferase involved in cell wall biosynthesis